MLRTFLSITLVLIFFSISINAQSDINRFQKQHRTNFNKKNLKNMQEMLVKSLESGNSHMIAGAAQTVRELQQIFPDESFNTLLTPLIDVIKDESGETSARILALFAVESLHTDEGDAAIKDLQKATTNKTIREICNAMFVPDLKVVEFE